MPRLSVLRVSLSKKKKTKVNVKQRKETLNTGGAHTEDKQQSDAG